MNVLRGLLGICFLVAICWLCSQKRSAINWRIVVIGISAQLIFCALVLYIPPVSKAFEILSEFFIKILDFTYAGAYFVFGSLVDKNKEATFGTIFAFRVLPTVIFFSAITSGLYYLGILQKLVYSLAWIMQKTMRLSGAESLSTAANIFLGQTEAPLLVKPFIAHMTRSELFCIMVGGMASIAGGVLATFILFLGGSDPNAQRVFAMHLISASIMSAPAAIVASKMIFPETEFDRIRTELEINDEKNSTNFIDALSVGAMDGLSLATNIGGMLIAFIAFITMINYILLDVVGARLGINDWIYSYSNGIFKGLSIEYLLGQLFQPIAFMIGIDWNESLMVGSLLGQKTALNEFVAYKSLADYGPGALSERGKILATYALCGFANFASIAIQVGGIGNMAPNQRGRISEMGLWSIFAGTIATLMTAAVVGIFI
jgi:CNT family concentrative nucleoside transporter